MMSNFFGHFWHPNLQCWANFLLYNVLNRKPCTCDGCELDNIPFSAKLDCWFKFQQRVPTDLISNFLSWVLMTTDVVTDGKTGYDLFRNGHILWAIATWIIMFLPAVLSLAMEILLEKCWVYIPNVLGHLPIGQAWYHFKIIWRLKQLRNEMLEQIEFYSELDYDNLPSGIKDQLEPRSKKFHDAKDEYNIIMSNLQTQKARPCSFILFIYIIHLLSYLISKAFRFPRL